MNKHVLHKYWKMENHFKIYLCFKKINVLLNVISNNFIIKFQINNYVFNKFNIVKIIKSKLEDSYKIKEKYTYNVNKIMIVKIDIHIIKKKQL